MIQKKHRRISLLLLASLTSLPLLGVGCGGDLTSEENTEPQTESVVTTTSKVKAATSGNGVELPKTDYGEINGFDILPPRSLGNGEFELPFYVNTTRNSPLMEGGILDGTDFKFGTSLDVGQFVTQNVRLQKMEESYINTSTPEHLCNDTTQRCQSPGFLCTPAGTSESLKQCSVSTQLYFEPNSFVQHKVPHPNGRNYISFVIDTSYLMTLQDRPNNFSIVRELSGHFVEAVKTIPIVGEKTFVALTPTTAFPQHFTINSEIVHLYLGSEYFKQPDFSPGSLRPDAKKRANPLYVSAMRVLDKVKRETHGAKNANQTLVIITSGPDSFFEDGSSYEELLAKLKAEKIRTFILHYDAAKEIPTGGNYDDHVAKNESLKCNDSDTCKPDQECRTLNISSSPNKLTQTPDDPAQKYCRPAYKLAGGLYRTGPSIDFQTLADETGGAYYYTGVIGADITDDFLSSVTYSLKGLMSVKFKAPALAGTLTDRSKFYQLSGFFSLLHGTFGSAKWLKGPSVNDPSDRRFTIYSK